MHTTHLLHQHLNKLMHLAAPVALAVTVNATVAPDAMATAKFQRVFIDECLKEHPDNDYVKFMRREARCLICHQGKGGHYNHVYGEHLAKHWDHEADKNDTEKMAAAIAAVNKLPYDPENPDGGTFGDRIAASKLPAGDDLKEFEQEFVELFDGESLEGWIGETDAYEVREGAIYSIEGKHGNLFTKDTYDNFELVFEFLLTPGANNGLGIRAPLEGDAAYQGIELQVLDNSAEKWANLKPYQYHGSAYGVAPAERGHLKPVGEWNLQRVQCEGRVITVHLNGHTILDIDLDELAPDGKTLDGQDHPGLNRTAGHIGFLGHGDVVAFRKLRLLELTAENADEK
jgi:hypothetical protein